MTAIAGTYCGECRAVRAMAPSISLPLFVVRPIEPATAGVVLIHEGGGISQQLLRFAQRLADAGYAVAAPDLFFRVGGTGAADFAELMGSVDDATLRADLTEARDSLLAGGVSKVAVTGFCMGGSFSYRAALWDLGFACAAPFYGSLIASELGQPVCPVQIFLGGSDAYAQPGDAEAVSAHHPGTVVYPKAGHGFMRDGSPDHDPEASADAWTRLLAFMGEHTAG